MTAPLRTCGSCSLCCKIMRIDELQKPMGVWCPKFKAGVGCSIHGSHPQSCNNYQCMWLINPAMPDAMRPDRSKVLINLDAGGASIVARADPAHPDAWRQAPIYTQLKRWAADYWLKGRTVYAMVGTHMWLIAPHEDVDLGKVHERSPISYEQLSTGKIKVTVHPPLVEDDSVASS